MIDKILECFRCKYNDPIAILYHTCTSTVSCIVLVMEISDTCHIQFLIQLMKER